MVTFFSEFAIVLVDFMFCVKDRNKRFVFNGRVNLVSRIV